MFLCLETNFFIDHKIDTKYGYWNTNKNAYAVLKQAFDEISALLKDFESELKKRGFNPVHSDNGVGAEISKSLAKPEKWIFRYITRYYSSKNENGVINKTVGIGVVYSKNEKPISPKFLMGVMISEGRSRRSYDYWWLSSMYRAKEDLKYRNLQSGDEVEEVVETGCWYKVIADGPDFDERWYDRGYLYLKELTDINTKSDITELAKKLDEKFNMINN